MAAERFGGDQRPHDRACEAAGGNRAEPGQPLRPDRFPGTGRQREYGVAVERRVRRPDRLRQAVESYQKKIPIEEYAG